MIKNVDVKETSEGVVEVSLNISKDNVEPVYQKSVQKIQLQAKIKGFRPGKAPVHLVKNIYSSQIHYETVNALLPSIFQQLEKEYNIKPMSTPEIDGLDDLKLDEDLQLKLTVETLPEVNGIPDIETISITKVEYDTNNETTLNKELEILQNLKAEYKDITSSIQEGNFVKAKFSISIDGVEKISETQYFNIKNTDPNYEISSLFIGKNLEEDYNENITFSDKFHMADLAGATAQIQFTLQEGKFSDKPEIDDKLAQQFEYNSLDELKQALIKVLEIRSSMRSSFENADRVFKEIAQQATFSISQKVVKNQAQNELQALFRKIMSQTTLENYLKEENLTDDGLIERTEKEARETIKKHLISEKLKEMFDIKTSEKELDGFIQNIASQEITNQKEIIQYYQENPERKESLKIQLSLKKLSEALLEKVKIADTEQKLLHEGE